MSPCRERFVVGLLLLATLAFRAWRLDQPIVENYVGRQVPTAMVARNLERGSGFFEPQLDTGPFPNRFLVEPPVYAAAVVALRRATGLPLEPTGRLTSALGVVLAAWGLYGLVRRREGPVVAAGAVAAFALFPVTLRYGRAFQPDALMLGALLASLRCWDESAQRRAGPGRWAWLAAGWVLLSLGLALKIIAAYLLVPLVGVIGRRARVRTAGLAALALLPALFWYVHAASVLAEGTGSRASADNRAIWLRVLVPIALLDPQTYVVAGRFFLVRAFTPLGVVLGLAGLLGMLRQHQRRPNSSLPTVSDRADAGPDEAAVTGALCPDLLFPAWFASATLALVLLAGKIHHEYYWLALAPALAAGTGRALGRLAGHGRRGGVAAGLLGFAFIVLALVSSASTWRTPREWADLPAAAGAIRARTPPDALVVAPEALLYAADRRGCRLEFGQAPAIRAAGEWGGALDFINRADSRTDEAATLALVEFYRGEGARYLADLGAAPGDGPRRALHAAARLRYAVLLDRPDVFLAELTPAGPPNLERPPCHPPTRTTPPALSRP